MLVAAAAVCLAASVHGQFTYVTNNGAITLTAYSGTNSSVTVSNFVTIIGPAAFAGNTNLTTVFFGGSVTNVGASAFSGCSKLSQIPALENGIAFGSNVFAYCTSLVNINVSGTSVGVGMFLGCTNIEDVSFESTVTNIGSFAFSGCAGLGAVPIFNAGTVFGSNIFSSCSGFTGVALSGTNVPNGMFANCTNLSHVSFSSGISNIGSYAFSGCGKITSLPTFNNGTVFGSNVFAGCGFSSISLTGFTNVPIGMFSGCTNLTSVYLGSVSNIGDYAFSGCSKLQTLPSFNTGTVFGSNVFSYCGFTSVALFNMGTLPIGMFQGCGNLSSISLGSISNIGNYALSGTALTQLPTLNSGTVLGTYVFSYCTNLSYADFHAFTNIPDGTFDGCLKLSSIEVNSQTAYVGSYAFSGCVQMPGVPDFNSGAIFGSYAFSFCTSLTGTSYYGTSIPDGLFEGCSNLTGVTVEGEVTNVGNFAFSGCSKLSYCPNIGPAAFYGSNVYSFCTSISYANIPGVNVGNAMFEGCTNLSEVLLGSVTNIGSDAFYGCSALGEINVPAAAANIGLDAFGDCANLTYIGVDSSNTNYSSVNGVLCNKFGTMLVQFPGGGPTNYTLPGLVTNIGADAFDGDTRLAGVVIPGKLTTIGANAFNNCSSLIGLLFAGNAPTNVNASAFASDHLGLYYLPGATGWGNSIDGITPLLWNPQIVTNGGNFGLNAGEVGFSINGTAGIPITISASTNLDAGAWTAVQSCTLTNGSIYFADPASSGYSNRFYTILFP